MEYLKYTGILYQTNTRDMDMKKLSTFYELKYCILLTN